MIWDDGTPQDAKRLTAGGLLRVLMRGVPMALLVFGGLVILLLTRVIERPLFGTHRPITPHITVFVCRNALRILRLDLNVQGRPMTARGAIVANHSSWLDIFVLNASKRIYFVSKSEVAGWPGIGWLARATGTVFIQRNPAQARIQMQVFQDRLLAGHKLMFFPEGTSTDGRRVLPFKTTLFAAFFAEPLRAHVSVQPVSVIYHAPPTEGPRFYGWWGDMSFGAHLVAMLAAPGHGRVDVIYHQPRAVADHPDRKSLARACETTVRAGFTASLSDTKVEEL